jgi:hypothetical protein
VCVCETYTLLESCAERDDGRTGRIGIDPFLDLAQPGWMNEQTRNKETERENDELQ